MVTDIAMLSLLGALSFGATFIGATLSVYGNVVSNMQHMEGCEYNSTWLISYN
ncbi:MAG: hypothetical protein V3T40_05270 [Nitrososphaerales archaeon]